MKHKPGNTTVSNCHFVGVQYDAKTVKTMTEIAKGLSEITKVYSQLAQVIRASNVNIEAMIKVDSGEASHD